MEDIEIFFLRAGNPNAISYKGALNDYSGYEIYGGFRIYSSDYNFFSANGAYLIYNNIPDVDNLSWYYGSGAGVSVYSIRDSDYNGDEGLGVNLGGYIGVEYIL